MSQLRPSTSQALTARVACGCPPGQQGFSAPSDCLARGPRSLAPSSRWSPFWGVASGTFSPPQGADSHQLVICSVMWGPQEIPRLHEMGLQWGAGITHAVGRRGLTAPAKKIKVKSQGPPGDAEHGPQWAQRQPVLPTRCQSSQTHSSPPRVRDQSSSQWPEKHTHRRPGAL